MRINVYNIQWDEAELQYEKWNSECFPVKELPNTIDIFMDDTLAKETSESELAEQISELLSKKYGFCNFGFQFKLNE